VQIEHNFIHLPNLENIIVDAHFRQRDRFGRLLTFMARILEDQLRPPPVIGIGVDDGTALAIGPDGLGTVFGTGGVYPILGKSLPEIATAGTPLMWLDLPYAVLNAGATFRPADFLNATNLKTVTATGGVLNPASPY
jgi:cyanophycinase-like exopeptidase